MTTAIIVHVMIVTIWVAMVSIIRQTVCRVSMVSLWLHINMLNNCFDLMLLHMVMAVVLIIAVNPVTPRVSIAAC